MAQKDLKKNEPVTNAADLNRGDHVYFDAIRHSVAFHWSVEPRHERKERGLGEVDKIDIEKNTIGVSDASYRTYWTLDLTKNDKNVTLAWRGNKSRNMGLKETFKLTESIKQEAEQIEILLENCNKTPYKPVLIAEAADKIIGHAIAALKAGKNPFETMPGSREILAGLMLLAKPTNRESLNMNQKKFDLITQQLGEKQALKKYVANIAQHHGKSLVKALDAYVQEKDKREVLTKKLVQLQNAYSQVKHKAGQTQEPFKKRIAV